MIEIDHLSVNYGSHIALDRVSLEARPGEILAIVGPNGSGKSSLVRAIAGTVPYDGYIRFHGVDRRTRIIGYMPQDQGLRATLTVVETVLLGRLGQLRLRVSKEDIEAAGAMMAELGIADLANRHLGELSGGQRQLVYLAQALAAHPTVLVLDEPLNTLDIRHQLEVMETLQRLTLARGLTTLIVMHDLQHAARYGDRVAILKAGKLGFVGQTRLGLTPERISETFGVMVNAVVLADGRVEVTNFRLAEAPGS